jgi:hypothetical protein
MAFWALPPLYQYAWTTLIPLLRIPQPQQQLVRGCCFACAVRACVYVVRVSCVKADLLEPST